MSYAIRYGQDTKLEAEMKRSAGFKRLVTLLVAVSFITAILWPNGQAIVRQLLFPWLDEGTIDAFGWMMDRIGEGAAIPVALRDFCRMVIGNAGILV